MVAILFWLLGCWRALCPTASRSDWDLQPFCFPTPLYPSSHKLYVPKQQLHQGSAFLWTPIGSEIDNSALFTGPLQLWKLTACTLAVFWSVSSRLILYPYHMFGRRSTLSSLRGGACGLQPAAQKRFIRQRTVDSFSTVWHHFSH